MVRIYVDDCFIGNYKDIEFVIEDLKINPIVKRNTNFANTCLVIRVNMKKNFTGHTVIYPNVLHNNDARIARINIEPVEPRPDLNLHKINLESVDFMYKYAVYSNDEVESRYLITPAFMERIDSIKTLYKAGNLAICFYNAKMYIAMFSTGDLFSLGPLKNNIPEYGYISIILEQICSIMDVIEYFKLDQKTGL